jgi:hypothetical protein
MNKIKFVLFLFKEISACLNTFVESFKKFLKTVKKGLQRNTRHIYLNVFNILKYVSPRAEKNAIKIVLTSLAEALAWCESPLLLLIRESVWDELCADLHEGLDELSPYWCLILRVNRDPCHHFTDICDCVCISRGWRTPASWIILKIPMPFFRWIKPFKYTTTT